MTVECELCPHHCLISKGNSGLCRVRSNCDGKLVARTYGRLSSIAVDPIEKKPFYHFFPGRLILSLGSVGCNLRCFFCQNWQISQVSPDTLSLGEISPERVVKEAVRVASVGVAFTYNEPFICWEFVQDTALEVRKRNLKNVLVTNGYVEEKPLMQILPLIDAMNIDLKAMDEDFYRKQCKGSLEAVLNTITCTHRHGVHLELTNLLVTGLNDSETQVERLVDWIARLDPGIPLHLSRYFPHFRSTELPTPLDRIQNAYVIARRKLAYVYLGNCPDAESAHTRCPDCGKIVIERYGYQVRSVNISDNCCIHCEHPIPVIYQ